MARARDRPASIALLALAILAGVVGGTSSAEAQQGRRIPVVGVLWPNPPASFEPVRQGLRDLRYIEGQSIAFE